MRAKTVRSGTLGRYKLRLVQKDEYFYGLADGRKCVEGPDPEDVWRELHKDAGKTDPNYIGYAGARSRFLKFFPGGFESEHFASMERDYKLAAKHKLDETVPLSEALTGSGFGEAVLSVYHATNMLSPYEKTRVGNMLRGPNADAFVQAAAQFAHEGPGAAVEKLARVLKPHDCAKWTIATYLPFLWRPEDHMYLKPEATKDFATRVGHRLASLYEPQLSSDVYACLLDLAGKTAGELSDLAPRDRIDIQSFIWVVGDYKEDGEEA